MMKRSITIVALMSFCGVFAVKNKTNSIYDQSDRQLLAQQNNNNNKIYRYYNSCINIPMKQPKKFNHKPRGNKSNKKIRYQ